MRRPKAAKPATAAGGEPASEFDQLSGEVGSEFKASEAAPQLKFISQLQAPASDSDRRFFAARPWRRLRLRRAFSGERRIAQLAGEAKNLQPGCSDFVVVEQIVPGVRIRVGFSAAGDLETDIGDEEIARLLQVRP
jgi:hypothetical protein